MGRKSHYQSNVFVCISVINDDNSMDAVDQLLIFQPIWF